MSVFTQFFTDVVHLHSYSGYNASGDITYVPPLSTEPTKLTCRIEYTNKEIVNAKGNQVISTATVYTDVPLKPLDILILQNTRYTVKSCTPIKDLYGQLDHYEVYL